MKATTYINLFKKENGTQDIMAIYMSDSVILDKSSVAAIVCAIPRTTKEILAKTPLKYVIYIYRETLDDVSTVHFKDYQKAVEYAKNALD